MIYHVALQSEWVSQNHQSDFLPSGYSKEGFIHCCTYPQLNGVLNRYYKDVKGLLLLHLDENKLHPVLKYEEGTNQELFPHLFGPINKDAIVKIESL